MSTVQDTTVVNPRAERGLRIVDRSKIRRDGATWLVPSESSSTKYRVDPAAGSCSCPDYEIRRAKCKHLWAVEYTITETTTTTEAGKKKAVTKTVRMTYRQEWRSYNAA